MICTSSYKNFNDNKIYKSYSISGDFGASAMYERDSVSYLRPKLSFWEEWHNNIGLITEEENNKFYVREYYRQVLMKLDPEEVYKKLNDSVLLCYEEPSLFCHRHIIAEWLQLFLGVKVPEIIIKDNKICVVERPKNIRKYLIEVIRNSIDTFGFESLRALYLYSKGEEYNMKAKDINLDYNSRVMYGKQAVVLMREACELEEKKVNNVKKLKRN